MFIIPDVLNKQALAEVRQLLSRIQWIDGKTTAGAGSDYQKNNLQGDVNDPGVQAGRKLIEAALMNNPRFRVLAIPKKVRPVTFNRYDEGMQYADHMDHAILPGEPKVRGDLSLTLFLSEPEDYEGGELVIQSDRDDRQQVKLPAGQALVYSAATLHRVNTVLKGSRLGAVTTVESMIRDDFRRELVGDMAQTVRWIQDVAPRTPEERRANKTYLNLLRLWSDV